MARLSRLAVSLPAMRLRAEQAEMAQWRAARLQSLTSDTGSLNLVGLLWLKDGEQQLRARRQPTLVLDNPALAEQAGYLRDARPDGALHRAPGRRHHPPR